MMMEKIIEYLSHKFRRWVQRIYIKFHRKLEFSSRDERSDENSQECLQICRSLILKEESLLLIAPLSEKRYVKNEALGIFIIIQNDVVQIINHTYSYKVVLTENERKKICRIYDLAIEGRRMGFENEIKANIKHSLKNIIGEIKNTLNVPDVVNSDYKIISVAAIDESEDALNIPTDETDWENVQDH